MASVSLTTTNIILVLNSISRIDVHIETVKDKLSSDKDIKILN